MEETVYTIPTHHTTETTNMRTSHDWFDIVTTDTGQVYALPTCVTPQMRASDLREMLHAVEAEERLAAERQAIPRQPGTMFRWSDQTYVTLHASDAERCYPMMITPHALCAVNLQTGHICHWADPLRSHRQTPFQHCANTVQMGTYSRDERILEYGLGGGGGTAMTVVDAGGSCHGSGGGEY